MRPYRESGVYVPCITVRCDRAFDDLVLSIIALLSNSRAILFGEQRRFSCSPVSALDTPASRSPQAVLELLATRVAGLELVEVSAGTGSISCLARAAKVAVAVEKDPQSCARLRQRANNELAFAAKKANFSVVCGSYLAHTPDADVYTWRQAAHLLNEPVLTRLRTLQGQGRVRSDASAYLLFNHSSPLDMASYARLRDLATWHSSIPFDECSWLWHAFRGVWWWPWSAEREQRQCAGLFTVAEIPLQRWELRGSSHEVVSGRDRGPGKWPLPGAPAAPAAPAPWRLHSSHYNEAKANGCPSSADLWDMALDAAEAPLGRAQRFHLWNDGTAGCDSGCGPVTTLKGKEAGCNASEAPCCTLRVDAMHCTLPEPEHHRATPLTATLTWTAPADHSEAGSRAARGMPTPPPTLPSHEPPWASRNGGARRALAVLMLGQQARLVFDSIADNVIRPNVQAGYAVEFFAHLERGDVALAWNQEAVSWMNDKDAGGSDSDRSLHGNSISTATLTRLIADAVLAAGGWPVEVRFIRRPRALFPSDRAGQRCFQYKSDIQQTVATALLKESLGLRSVLRREETLRRRYEWVLLLREDAYWFAPLHLTRFTTGYVHGKACGQEGGWNDKLWLIHREHMVAMLSMYKDLHVRHAAECRSPGGVAFRVDPLRSPNSEIFRARVGELHRIPYMEHSPESLPTMDAYYTDGRPAWLVEGLERTEGASPAPIPEAAASRAHTTHGHDGGLNASWIPPHNLCFTRHYAANCVPQAVTHAVDHKAEWCKKRASEAQATRTRAPLRTIEATIVRLCVLLIAAVGCLLAVVIGVRRLGTHA